jgi:hypothetical protein
MNISVAGTRTSTVDWEAVRDLPESSLPSLTPEQRAVAGKLGISPVDYARSALAGERSQEKLLAKTETFARLLQAKAQGRAANAEIKQVRLETIERQFYVDLVVDGRQVSMKIDENLVSDLLEGGASEAERKLDRIVGLTLAGKAA